MGEKNKKSFNKILKDIKEVKIQGARNIAKAALEAYSLIPAKSSIKKLLSSRPTEPMMENILEMASKGDSIHEINSHFNSAQEKINNHVLKLLKNGDVIFTHCHSTNVVNALIYSKRKGKKFEVYNTETRPLLQGRRTAKQLKNAGIPVTMFIDSALGIALTKSQGTKKVDKIFLGADALMENGIINKVGSELVAQIAKDNKIPVYIVADSWKFTNKKVPIEQRNLREVWDHAPNQIKVRNPAFEFVPKKFITGIVSEYGILSYDKFIKKARKNNPQ